MRIYIAGPMTGLPGHNLTAFHTASLMLAAHGHDPVNPGRHGILDGHTWRDYMRAALTDLVGCDAVALLPGWEQSRGAQLEVHIAQALDMPVELLPVWLDKVGVAS